MPGKSDGTAKQAKLKIIPENTVLRSSSSPSVTPRHSADEARPHFQPAVVNNSVRRSDSFSPPHLHSRHFREQNRSKLERSWSVRSDSNFIPASFKRPKPTFPVMGSVPRIKGLTSPERRVSFSPDSKYRDSTEAFDMTRSAYELSSFDFPTASFWEEGEGVLKNACSDNMLSGNATLWIPSPHIINTKDVYSDGCLRPDRSPTQSLPRMRYHFKYQSQPTRENENHEYPPSYYSRTLPSRKQRKGLMMGSTSSGRDWPQTKSQIITNITAHYKRSLSVSSSTKSHSFPSPDVDNVTPPILAIPQRFDSPSPPKSKEPSPPHLRISTYDNVSPTEETTTVTTTAATGSVYAERRNTKDSTDPPAKPTSLSDPSSSQQHPFQRTSDTVLKEEGGGDKEPRSDERGGRGSITWSSQRQRSRLGSGRDFGQLDENAEWEEIERIMSSFGAGIVRRSLFEQEGYEEQFTQHLSPLANQETNTASVVPASMDTASTTSSSAGLWSVSSASGLSSESSSSGVHNSSSSTIATGEPQNVSDSSSFDQPSGSSMAPLSEFLRPPSTVRDWLSRIGLTKYERQFVTNGFDDPKFLDCVEERDLLDVGIGDFEHRMELLQAATMTNLSDPSNDIFLGSNSSVEEWLASLNLRQYGETFRKCGIEDLDQAVKVVTEAQLLRIGVSLVGHRRRITQSVNRRNPRPSNPSSNASSDSLGFEDCFPRKFSDDREIFERNLLILNQKRRAEERLALEKMAALYRGHAHAGRAQMVHAELVDNQRALEDISRELRKFEMSQDPPTSAFPPLDANISRFEGKQKSIPLVREPSMAILNEEERPIYIGPDFPEEGFSLSSPTTSDESEKIDEKRKKSANDKTDKITSSFRKNKKNPSINEIQIRAPHETQNASAQAAQIQRWCHAPEKLLKRSCDYNAFYLGSTLINNLQENESIAKSIKKIKDSTANIVKVPEITLSISYRGVSFRDSATSIAICDHEIRNIHCAAQDEDDLRFLAYVTKDEHVDKHFCHVFKATSMVLASEIILTLGQAFEVAYQLALQLKMGSSSFGNGKDADVTRRRTAVS